MINVSLMLSQKTFILFQNLSHCILHKNITHSLNWKYKFQANYYGFVVRKKVMNGLWNGINKCCGKSSLLLIFHSLSWALISSLSSCQKKLGENHLANATFMTHIIVLCIIWTWIKRWWKLMTLITLWWWSFHVL